MTYITRTAESLADAENFAQMNAPQCRRDARLDMAATIGRGFLLILAAAAVGIMLHMAHDLATGLPGVIERAKVEAAQ